MREKGLCSVSRLSEYCLACDALDNSYCVLLCLSGMYVAIFILRVCAPIVQYANAPYCVHHCYIYFVTT